VLKLNAAGEFVRVTQLHRNSSTFAADPHGNLALVGNYPANSTLDINPSPTEEFL